MAMANSTTSSGTGQANNQGPTSLAYQLTSGKAYDPDAVYCDASDGRGHYEQINVKLSPRLEHVIDIIVAEHPNYRSRQDFIRDAMFHRAYEMATNGPTADPLAEQLVEAEANRQRTEMRARLREEQNRDLNAAKEAVEDMLRDRDWYAVNEELDRVALLTEDEGLPAGVRDRYNELWMELTDALTRARTKEIRRQQALRDNN